MKETLQVIQIGGVDWRESFSVPASVKWTFRTAECPEQPGEDEIREALSEKSNGRRKRPRSYDAVIVDGIIDPAHIEFLLSLGAAYVYFFTERAGSREVIDELVRRKFASPVREQEIKSFIQLLPIKYFNGQEGSKLKPAYIIPASRLESSLVTDGNRSVVIEGNFGKTMKAALFWKYNIMIRKDLPTELWLEYSKSEGVEIEFMVRLFREGALCEPLWSKSYSEEDLQMPLLIADNRGGYLCCELLAKGRGRLEVGNLHFRKSRLSAGTFLAGGERHVFPGGEEFISYFDPGDLKPPLNVYFSGYRTAEGFEGYFIMKRMGAPFLLIGDPRLEGGGFYLGSPDYEQGIADLIRGTLETLGFDNRQLVMSGLSMGTFGAAYYACDLLPHAVIIGKPLMSIGNVAANEKRIRPGGFPTSLDVLRSAEGGIDEGHIQKLNRRFWQRFDVADFSATKFVISYMYQDDYDTTGYPDILRHLSGRRVALIGKGLEGRHNDNTSGVVSWFMSRYHSLMKEDFGREVKA